MPGSIVVQKSAHMKEFHAILYTEAFSCLAQKISKGQDYKAAWLGNLYLEFSESNERKLTGRLR